MGGGGLAPAERLVQTESVESDLRCPMPESGLLQRQREILRTFRQATAQRAQAEADAEARREADREVADAALSKVRQEAETRRTEAEADADACRKTEREAADATLDQVRQFAAAQLAEARQAQETTKVALAQVELQHLLEQTQLSPTTPRSGANPAQELTRSLSVSTNASKRIQLSVEALQRLRKATAWRRGLLAAFAVIAILFLAAALTAAGFLGYQGWRIKRTYRTAVAALDAGEWEKAQAELQQLISLDNNYEDAQTLLRESYYRSAVVAFDAGEWEKARAELQQLISLDSNYKDAQALLRESYYRPAVQALEAREWDKARAELEASVAAVEAEQLEEVRAELEHLLDLYGDYEDAQTLLSEIYHSRFLDLSFFIAINSNGEMYAFPAFDEPHQGYFIGYGDAAAVADFDNDGFCEVLAARESDRYLRLYESDGGTGFVETVVSDDAYPSEGFSLVRGRSDSAAGDFDNNNLLDFAFTGRRCTSESCPSGGQGLIQVHLNRGNGHFERRSINVSGFGGRRWEGMQGLDDGDFNADGSLDLAAQQYWAGPNNITHLFFGNGDGTFVDSPKFTHPNYDGTPALLSGDFDNDQHFDLIIGQDDADDPGQTWLYVGDGTGAFAYFGSAYDTNLAVESGDNQPGSGYSDAYYFDSDGNLDAIADANAIGLLLFKGNGDGTFQSPLLLTSEAKWEGVATPTESQPACTWGGQPGLSIPHM